MSVRIATGLAEQDAGTDSFAEAAGRAALGLGGAPADVAVVFASSANLAHAESGLEAVHDRLGAPAALLGCGAQGVVAGARELETGGVAVWAASLPDGRVDPFRLDALPAGEGQMAVAGLPDFAGAEAAVMIADPYTFPVEPLLDRMAEDEPGLPVVGGLASAGEDAGETVLFHDATVERSGAVGFTLSGVDVRPCVSQGARPIGPEMVVTSAEGNRIHELASRPALRRLQEAIGELDPAERALAGRGLLLGIVIDENQPDYERGDFLVRQIIGVDEREAAVLVAERVRVGQTVRLHVRDGESAGADLRAVLAREAGRLAGPPAGALVFTCNGRGRQMFGMADQDALAVERAFGGAPAAGFFCAGEIGPVGGRSFVHGFTATLALFADA